MRLGRPVTTAARAFLDPGEQPAHRLFELLHAVDQQFVGDLLERRARLRKCSEIAGGSCSPVGPGTEP